MKTKYLVELADNGMIVRREDIGELRVIEYDESDNERSITPVAKFLGEDILDDMLESPQIQEETKKLISQTDIDAVNDFEIEVVIRPIIKEINIK
jgi:hypothetical protein